MSQAAPSRQRFLLRVCAVAIAMIALAEITTRFVQVAIDGTLPSCLPYTAYVIYLTDAAPQRGQFARFESPDIPVRGAGLPFIKIVAGVPGDRVVITPTHTTVAGVEWGAPNPDIIRRAGLTDTQVYRSFTLRDGEFFTLGTLPQSYDSRYWGVVTQDRFKGRAWPLW